MADDYLARVVESYQGEVFGEAIFREMAERCDDPDQTYKFQVLEQLERETKERLRPLVAKLGGDVAEDPKHFAEGAELAERWARQSWDELMTSFQAELPKYVRFFEKLEADGRVEDREILAATTAHEKAIEAFAELEVTGQGERSLEPILALLAAVPQREA